jgi:ElaB/YqjD/DUF883 family membrane-anchored ribosome-binding protein
MDTQTYIKQFLSEHLLTDDYKLLSTVAAKNKMEDIKAKLKSLIKDNTSKLSKAESTFFQRSFLQHHRTHSFNGLPEVHKTPITLRPVVSTSGSFLAIFSTPPPASSILY